MISENLSAPSPLRPVAVPCLACHSLERRLFLWANVGDFFRKDPQVESLVGTTWVLVSRRDSDGLLERVFPGGSIEFRATRLICRAASGEVCGGRSWEPSAWSAPASLPAYSTLFIRDYTAAVVEITRNKDRMVWVPALALSRNRSAQTLHRERYQGTAMAIYRPER